MKVPKNGMVATSDRSIKFGTIVEFDGREYVVEDRTSYCLIPGEKCKGFRSFDKHTIDIFSEEGCDKFEGTKNKLVKIYK